MINPDIRYCGIAGFVANGSYFYAGAGLFAYDEDGLNEAQTGVRGNYYQIIEAKPSKFTVRKKQSVNVYKGAVKKVHLQAVSKYRNESNDPDNDPDFRKDTYVYLMRS